MEQPPPIPRERKTKFLESATSNEDSISSGTKTIIIEKADVHRSAPPIPLPRKKLTNQTKSSPKISTDSQSDDKTSVHNDNNNIPSIPTITEVRAIKKISKDEIVDDDKNSKTIQFFENKHLKSQFFIKSIKSDVENSSIESIDNQGSKTPQVVAPKKSSILPLHQRDKISVKTVNEKKFKKDKLPIVVENNSSSDEDEDEKSIESSSNEINSDEYTSEETELKENTKELTKGKVKHPKEVRLNSKTQQYQYNYEHIIGIYIHETSELKFDQLITSPMIRISIIDGKVGKYLAKSDPSRNVILNLEPKNVEFIQPIISKRCNFKNEDFIQCIWEELLIINEDINHIMSGDVLIFFELLDIIPSDQLVKNSDGWYYISWAFLKPGDGSSYSNINQRVCLQFYKYRNRKNQIQEFSSTIGEWKNKNKIKYPATLNVTIKAMKANVNPMSLTRPIHAFQFERTSIQPISHTIKQNNERKRISFKEDVNSENDVIDDEIQAKEFGRNIPGQPFKFPNYVLKTTKAYNCLVSKFSQDGRFLAFTSTISRKYQIIIVAMPEMKVIKNLNGHTNLIYDLDWIQCSKNSLSNNALISASSDRTCIYWTWDENSVSLKILPHPTFVYAVRVVMYRQHITTAVTGGRDGIVRIWKIYSEKNMADLFQELEGHSAYITALSVSRSTKNIFSVDWNGTIIEWQCNGNSTNSSYDLLRKIAGSQKTFSIILHPHEDKIFAHSIDSIKCFDISTGISIQSFDLKYHGKERYKFAVSLCGTFIFTTYQYKIIAWSLYASTQQYTFNIIANNSNSKMFISSMNFHPNGNLLCVSVYGENGVVYLLSNSYHDLNNSLNLNTQIENHHLRNDLNLDNTLENKFNSIENNNKLSDIIRRVDEIFNFGSAQLNQTDDYKVTEQSQKSIPIAEPEDILVDNEGSMDSELEGSDDSNRTFTIEKKSSNSSDNRTFNVSKSANDGTYNVEKEKNNNLDDDETDISQSL